MGITPLHAQLIVREHQRKRLPDTVHLLGRQTVALTLDEAIALIERIGVKPETARIEIDRQTRGAQAARKEYISDRTFFGLMGVRDALAIDCSNYEGADIILDLNQPLPAERRETVEFLFGGSVLDNVFDPAAFLRNVTGLLKPGGRLFDQSIISQHHHPYCLVTPAWMLDYFVLNSYADCSVYISEHSPSGFTHMYGLDPEPGDFVSDFGPPRGQVPIGLVTIAEKGPGSSGDLTPIQDQYRSVEEQACYDERLTAMTRRRDFFKFAAPTPLELCRLGRRTSKSFRYLGVIRSLYSNSGDASGGDGNSMTGLRIFEATYGGNCLGAALPKSGVCSVYRGNVTEIVASLFNGVESHQWLVDVNVLGDPAPQYPKDLEVFYCSFSENAPRLHRAYLPAEASGQILDLAAGLLSSPED